MLDIFGIKVDFSDYTDAYVFAKKQKVGSHKAAVSLPKDVKFEWSPLNGYEFQYASSDGEDKYWRCFYGHTFTRRLDVIRRGSKDCPFCTGFLSFQYLYLGTTNNLRVVLDINTAELDFLSDDYMHMAFNKGINIGGALKENGMLIFSVDYLVNMSYGAFRYSFDRLWNRRFVAMNNAYSSVADDLTNIFSLDIDTKKLHKTLNSYILSLK